jgi:hypothetical protein
MTLVSLLAEFLQSGKITIGVSLGKLATKPPGMNVEGQPCPQKNQGGDNSKAGWHEALPFLT